MLIVCLQYASMLYSMLTVMPMLAVDALASCAPALLSSAGVWSRPGDCPLCPSI